MQAWRRVPSNRTCFAVRKLRLTCLLRRLAPQFIAVAKNTVRLAVVRTAEDIPACGIIPPFHDCGSRGSGNPEEFLDSCFRRNDGMWTPQMGEKNSVFSICRYADEQMTSFRRHAAGLTSWKAHSYYSFERNFVSMYSLRATALLSLTSLEENRKVTVSFDTLLTECRDFSSEVKSIKTDR